MPSIRRNMLFVHDVPIRRMIWRTGSSSDAEDLRRPSGSDYHRAHAGRALMVGIDLTWIVIDFRPGTAQQA
jgi:hypothetical protein